MKIPNVYTETLSLLTDALNKIGERDDDHDDARLRRLGIELEAAIDKAQQLATDVENYVFMDHDAAAEDAYWEARIDEAMGK